MEERDLSVLSFRKLIQMLDAILSPLQNNGDGGVEKQMQKFQREEAQETEEELKNVEEQLKSSPFSAKEELEEVVNDYPKEELRPEGFSLELNGKEEKEIEPEEEVLPFPRDDDAKEKQTEARVNEEEKEEEKEPTELKISPFPREEKLEEVSGNNPSEKMKVEGSQVLETAKTVPNIPRYVRQVRRWLLQSASHTKNVKKDDEHKHSFRRQDNDGKEEKKRWRLDRARFINCCRSPKLDDCSFLGSNGFLIYKRRTAQPQTTFSLTTMKQQMGLGLEVKEKTLILQENKTAVCRKTHTRGNQTHEACKTTPSAILDATKKLEAELGFILKKEGKYCLQVLLLRQKTKRDVGETDEATTEVAKPVKRFRVNAYLNMASVNFVPVEVIFWVDKKNEVAFNKVCEDIDMWVSAGSVLGVVAYRLDLPPSARVHLVFHILVLKKSVQTGFVTPTIPPTLTEQLELQIQPEAVICTRTLTNVQLEVLIQWKDMPLYENSWEDAEMLATQFPDFHLEYKVMLLGDGNVRTPFAGQT